MIYCPSELMVGEFLWRDTIRQMKRINKTHEESKE